MIEEERVGWPHLLNGHEFEQAPAVGDGQESVSAAVRGVAKSQTLLATAEWEILPYRMAS